MTRPGKEPGIRQLAASNPNRKAEEYLVKHEILAELPGELGDALDGDLGGVVEVVDHDDLVASQEELQDGVAPDVACAAGDQDGLRFRRDRHRYPALEQGGDAGGALGGEISSEQASGERREESTRGEEESSRRRRRRR